MALGESVKIELTVDAQEVKTSLIEALGRDGIIELIKDLDWQMQDWDFTLELYKYFKNQKKQYKKETKMMEMP